MVGEVVTVPLSTGIEKSLFASMALMEFRLGKCCWRPSPRCHHFPDVVSITQLSWSTQAGSLLGETKPEDVLQPAMCLQSAGPDSPSSEGNNLETHLLWTSGTAVSTISLCRSAPMSYCQHSCSLCVRSSFTNLKYFITLFKKRYSSPCSAVGADGKGSGLLLHCTAPFTQRFQSTYNLSLEDT